MSKERENARREITRKTAGCILANIKKEENKNNPTYIANKKDADERCEIQNTILKMAKSGKGKVEILTYLMNKFPNSENSKYYAGWIDHKFKKLNIIEKDSEGR